MRSFKALVIILVCFIVNTEILAQSPSILYGIRIPGRYNVGQYEAAMEIEVPSGSYNAIRAYSGTQGVGTIHWFDDTWAGGDIAQSAGAININALSGLSVGPWNEAALTTYFKRSNGFVGLGTTNPTARLHIYSTYSGGSGDYTNTTGAQLKIQASSEYFRVVHLSQNASVSGVYNYQTGKDVYWGEPSDMGNYYFRGRNLAITEGNFGIGTSSPQSLLELKSSGANLATIRVQGQNNNNAALRLNEQNGWRGGFMEYIPATNQFVIGVHDADNKLEADDIMAISIERQSGDVGIGTLSPDSKLTVKGVIHTEEVKVDLNVPGPDYVFESDYHLATLEDTKAYIEQNKHLPGIPSSDEMQQNGVNLLEMNMKLLEKVEELTLYLIQQNTRLDEQQKRIEQLENKGQREVKN